MSFPKYPDYKDSGVAWLGEVPEHWEVARFSRVIAAIKDGTHGTFQRVAEGRPLLSAKNVLNGHLDIGGAESLISDSDHAEIVANGFPCKGDLLLTIVGTIGRTCVYEETEPFAFQRSVCFIRLHKEFSPHFFYYFFQSKFFQEQLVGKSKSSAQAGVYMGDVASTSILFPRNANEQTAIATFLDRETVKIDALVAEQETLIALLQEKRQAVISHAVTKGLNPNVPMKDSGVEWLGEVPGHWEIKSIYHILEAIGDVDHFMPASVEKGVPYLMTGDLKEFVSEVDFDGCKQVSNDDYIGLSKKIKNSRGDVIMARYATIGTSMYVDINIDFLVSYSCVTLKTDCSKMSGLYLFKYMKSIAFLQGIENKINANTQGNVGIKDLQSTKIAVPPVHEQTAIATFLDRETTKLDTLMTEARTAITLLQERRTALISAAVTGQIDVRALAGGANAPDSVAASAYPASA